MKKSWKITSAIALAFILIISGTLYYHQQVIYPSTNDAYVQAHIIHIAPRVNGMVSNVYIHNQQYVHRGEKLFDIDPTPFQIALRKAQSELDNTIQQVHAAASEVAAANALVAERQAEFVTAKKQYQRIHTLVARKLYSQASGDQAVNNYRVAKAALTAAKSQLNEAKQKLGTPGQNNAQIRAAKAAVADAKLNLQYTHITAPANGYIAKFQLQTNGTIPPNWK